MSNEELYTRANGQIHLVRDGLEGYIENEYEDTPPSITAMIAILILASVMLAIVWCAGGAE